MSIVAAIQMVSTSDLTGNLQQADRLIRRAADAGAKLIVLPEVFAMFNAAKQREIAEQEASSCPPIQTWLKQQCIQYGIWIVAGTIPLLVEGETKRVSTSTLIFDDQGNVRGQYNKIHLFDVDVADGHGSYRESDVFVPGEHPLTLDTPFGRLGVAVCYDIRFPELFRLMCYEGMDILAVPAAFTLHTGEAHWLPLLRARAIENQVYVIGANQGGQHSSKRKTSGGSVLLDPWGQVLGEAGRGEAVICGNIDLEYVKQLRRNMPIAKHQKIFSIKS